jgi:hypothetical protein
MAGEVSSLMFLTLAQLPVFAVMAGAGLGLFRLSRRLDPRWTLPAANILLVLLTVMPSFFGEGGGEVPFDDVYFPFLLYPGPLIGAVEFRLGGLVWPWMNNHAGYRPGSYICIVVIPAVLTAVLGALFWFVVARLVSRKFKRWGRSNEARTSDR